MRYLNGSRQFVAVRDDDLTVVDAERSLEALDREIEAEMRRHLELIRVASLSDLKPKKGKRVRPEPASKAPMQTQTIEFQCAGCGELITRELRGGPVPLYCSRKCLGRVWRHNNLEKARAAERRYDCKRSGRHALRVTDCPPQFQGSTKPRCVYCNAEFD